MAFAPIPNQFSLLLTLLTPLLLVSYTAFRLYKDTTPFNWHPIFESVGYLLFVLGILQFRRKDVPPQTRIRYHWLCELCAVFFLLYANKTVFDVKEANSKEHFVSWHSKLGVLTALTAIGASIGGLCALYSGSLKRFVKPSQMKAIHRMGGTVLFCLSTGALLLGLCTQWFQENVAFNFWLVSIVGVAISGLYVVLKPIGTILRK